MIIAPNPTHDAAATPGRAEARQLPAGLLIRRPTAEERMVLHDVFRRSWAQTYRNSMAEPERFLELPENAHVKSNSLCAILDGQPIGFIELSRHVHEKTFLWKTFRTEVINVSRLYVDPLHQSRGVGRELLAAIRRYYPGAAFIVLTVLAGTRRVEDFYCRCGFQRIMTLVTDGGEAEPLRLHMFRCPADGMPRSRLSETAMCFEEAGKLQWPQRREARGIDGPIEPE